MMRAVLLSSAALCGALVPARMGDATRPIGMARVVHMHMTAGAKSVADIGQLLATTSAADQKRAEEAADAAYRAAMQASRGATTPAGDAQFAETAARETYVAALRADAEQCTRDSELKATRDPSPRATGAGGPANNDVAKKAWLEGKRGMRAEPPRQWGYQPGGAAGKAVPGVDEATATGHLSAPQIFDMEMARFTSDAKGVNALASPPHPVLWWYGKAPLQVLTPIMLVISVAYLLDSGSAQ